MEAIAANLEKQELEVALAGVPLPGLSYAQLLGIYLCQNDMCNAKFLWKRIPEPVKASCKELSKVWNIGKKIWVRDFPGIYTALSEEWPPEIADIMIQLRAIVRERAAKLVAKGYSSISLELLSSLTGLTLEEAEKEAVIGGWEIDPNTKFVYPRKPIAPPTPAVSCEEQLTKLTDFVSFLEN